MVDANLFGPLMVAEPGVVEGIPLQLGLRVLLLILFLVEFGVVRYFFFVPIASLHYMRILAVFTLFDPAKPAKNEFTI